MRVRLSQVTGAIDSTPATPLPVVSPRRGRILLIDDDPAVAATMSRVIEEHHDVEIVTRARSALDLVRSGKWYDVVFCDLMMPEMTGIDFYEEIVSHYPDVTSRIIFITGGAFTVRAREFLDRVPNQRVEKPFDARVLLALIDKRLR
jgi:CheY-like chemotaxis protein